MKCNECNGELRVKYNKRSTEHPFKVMRRRECQSCGKVYKTIEVLEDNYNVADEFISDLKELIKKHYK